MRLTIALAVSAFLLSGCLESSSSTSSPPVQQNEVTDPPVVDTPDVVNPPVVNDPPDVVNPPVINNPPVVVNPPVVNDPPDVVNPPARSAVADMVVNSIDAAGDIENFWDCSADADADSLFQFAIADNGNGLFQNSAETSALTWEENTNGTMEFYLSDLDIFVELRNFTFVSLFEFTADQYQANEFIETNRCKLTDVEDEPEPTGDTEFFVTAASFQDEDDLRYVWSCAIGSEVVVISFFRDETGFFFFSDENDEIAGVALSNWAVSGNTLETFVDDGTGEQRYVTLDSIDRGNDSFSVGDFIIGDDSFGEASCVLLDTSTL